jgi:hypothetical protein
MLAELQDLLGARPASATREDYRRAIVEDNLLGKRTMTARRNTFRALAELYILDRDFPVFGSLRYYWNRDVAARPLLALLAAAARDPLLRRTAPTVLAARPGEVVAVEALGRAVEEGTRGRFSPTVRRAVASRLASSWAQAGHLTGTRTRRRARPTVTPGSTAYALALGYLQGVRGPLLFHTPWAKLLDRPEAELRQLASEASRRNWLDYRQAGNVIVVRFPGLFPEMGEGGPGGET